MKTRVLLVDDHVSVRQMVGVILLREADFEVVGEARTGFEALEFCRREKPDLVILDLTLPELNGAEVVTAIRAELRDTRVLVYSASYNRELIRAVLRARPHGFVHKEDSLATFREALRAVMSGCRFLTPFASEVLDEAGSEESSWSRLNERERSVLQMVAEGMSSKQMAERLEISAKTVDHHRMSLMEKLGLHDVAGLTRFAVQQGLVSLE